MERTLGMLNQTKVSMFGIPDSWQANLVAHGPYQIVYDFKAPNNCPLFVFCEQRFTRFHINPCEFM